MIKLTPLQMAQRLCMSGTYGVFGQTKPLTFQKFRSKDWPPNQYIYFNGFEWKDQNDAPIHLSEFNLKDLEEFKP